MTALTIRQATVEDAPELACLNRLFNGVDAPPEVYAARLDDPTRADTALLAYLDSEAAGVAVLRLLWPLFYAEPYAELTELFVEESARRKGVASALVRAAEALAINAGAQDMLIVTDRYNAPAIGLYNRLGYRGEDLVLSKALRTKP